MDSRTTFGVLVILVAIGGAYLAITGKFQQMLAVFKLPAPATSPALQNDAGQAGTSGAAGGSYAPQTGNGTTTNDGVAGGSWAPTQIGGAINGTVMGVQQQLGTPSSLLSYQNPIGNDGAALAPIGSATFGGFDA